MTMQDQTAAPTRMRLLAKALRRALWPQITPRRFDVLVCSPGGVGTTFVMKHLHQFVKTNAAHDQDGLKHPARPPLFLRGRPRILFIHGDPDVALRSIIRRGFFPYQAAKLGLPACVVLGDTPLGQRFYLRGQARQLARFKRYRGDVLCVAFDEIWDRLDDIARFAGVDPATFARDFPPRRARASQPEGAA
ncbi:hypothetical protein LGQ03_15545 [Loktanella sp. TSTF-M6]|uniref:Uncharacterized protein n=1 Tax=Loktanella gaetbuli TaxID=2881335 RepID=A0ABS8BY41_9RHOB|nr:hypothetical protein [Loktanella gaetbuli]MCB5200652.1 hypothetical protein [Loktanella gaetbuli]